MKYGLSLPNWAGSPDARPFADLAALAEAAGWDGFFIWDHVFHLFPVVDPWLALAAIALNTEHIRLGAMVTPLPRRRPVKLARETVTLDHLSWGRITFGVGIGDEPWEWRYQGEETSMQVRGDMLDEGLALLAACWRGGEIGHRRRDEPFDVAASGWTPGDGAAARDRVAAYAAAGATWWVESLDPWRYDWDGSEREWPLAAMRERIEQGPPSYP